MSNYKNFQLRQLGLKEGQFPPSKVDANVFPGIDPEEKQTEPSDRERMLSPTAIATPVIGVTVRGSNTGGLPSGKNITPKNLGGYELVNPEKDNSQLVDKTPDNTDINSSTPISDSDKTIPETPHPHQIQKDANEPPQELTGAPVNADTDMTLKSVAPAAKPAADEPEAEGEVSVDVDEEAKTPEEKDNKPMVSNKTEKHFKKVNDVRLEEVLKKLHEKAIAGKMNKQESDVFSLIKEVKQKRKLNENQEKWKSLREKSKE
jgi:hypothetical protein